MTEDTALAARLSTVPDAIAAIERGEMVVVVDEPHRENEGDLVMAAEHATPEAMNFMATHGRGLICVPMREDRLRRLDIPEMAPGRADAHGTAFYAGVDVRAGTSTGISARDRALTARALADPASTADMFLAPGHLFPLAARHGGVLQRAGHTEAAVDLATMAGCRPAAVICEIASADGEMARLPELLDVAEAHGLAVIAITDLIAHRRRLERQVERVRETDMPLEEGRFRAVVYRDHFDEEEHIALVLGDLADAPPLVRVHAECVVGDVFSAPSCGCGEQLHLALQAIAQEGRGVLVYIRGPHGRGLGLGDAQHAHPAVATAPGEAGRAPSDRQDLGIGMQILQDLGVADMRLLTNNTVRRPGLEGYGLRVVDRVPLVPAPS